MPDCIIFKDDGTTKLMQVKHDQKSVNIAIPDSLNYIGYDIRHFTHKVGSDGLVYLIASLDPVEERLVIDALNQHRPQPIEWLQNIK